MAKELSIALDITFIEQRQKSSKTTNYHIIESEIERKEAF